MKLHLAEYDITITVTPVTGAEWVTPLVLGCQEMMKQTRRWPDTVEMTLAEFDAIKHGEQLRSLLLFTQPPGEDIHPLDLIRRLTGIEHALIEPAHGQRIM